MILLENIPVWLPICWEWTQLAVLWIFSVSCNTLIVLSAVSLDVNYFVCHIVSLVLTSLFCSAICPYVTGFAKMCIIHTKI